MCETLMNWVTYVNGSVTVLFKVGCAVQWWNYGEGSHYGVYLHDTMATKRRKRKSLLYLPMCVISLSLC